MQVGRSFGARRHFRSHFDTWCRARPNALSGWATKNYFAVLVAMEEKIKEVEAAGSPEHGARIQIVPVNTGWGYINVI